MPEMNRPIATVRGAVLIREATVTDALQFRALRLEALQDSPTAFSADYEANLNQPAEYWESRLKADEDATIFLSEHEHNLIGMTGIVRGRSKKSKHSAWIWGVYMTPAWRGLRIAEELINSCCEWAKARGVVIVKLGVGSTNMPAIRCYERCGFTGYGTEPRAGFVEGKYYDELLMYRSLDGS